MLSTNSGAKKFSSAQPCQTRRSLANGNIYPAFSVVLSMQWMSDITGRGEQAVVRASFLELF
ncbi:MAG: hypothetical protein WCO86_01945 [Planctomycetota bacterium]